MKKIFSIILGLIIFTSCDPDVPGEGINLPAFDFIIDINKDTSFHKLGDTITLRSKTNTNISNGIKINNGKITTNFSFAYRDMIPITSEAAPQSARIGIEFEYQLIKGNVGITSSNTFNRIYANPMGDTFEFEIKIIPKKVGTYSLSMRPNFFEGTQGKTRTNPYFDMVRNNGEELWQVPGYPALTPSDPLYKTLYYFAVTE